ncbi:hypothetical protein R5R35_012828 [Gryllus longicercus]|uniref:Uncharacterized protein n=1 Tax=Gryllus longicercus TaxID=2509291 RepID=A0AAN9VML0_9ORTH
MPLDWLFGSKKKSEPDPTPHHEDKANASGDEFVVLDADQTLPSRGDGSGMYPQLPYALAPKSQTNPESHTTHSSSASTNEVTTALGFLSGVPFKLTSTDTFEGREKCFA